MPALFDMHSDLDEATGCRRCFGRSGCRGRHGGRCLTWCRGRGRRRGGAGVVAGAGVGKLVDSGDGRGLKAGVAVDVEVGSTATISKPCIRASKAAES